MSNPISRGGDAPLRSLVRPMFRTLSVAASGLSAQRQRLEVIATNIANAETTRTADGTPYRRRVVRFEAEALPAQVTAPAAAGAVDGAREVGGDVDATQKLLDMSTGIRVAGVEEDMSEGPLVYDPGHPDADAAGYVRYPNVRITDEMVDLMDARRVYEANATVFQSAKAMLRRALEI